ncbi:uncharacterized protein N7482_008137 [Penicillium canariense]|uniref:Uncharacterized protein n=1 Tax=Penicillium canariense TaxID=189055 RepID=A0A9W9HTD2_9EURO|nr:uncharacterized protein N7482_008137 [Penicillium canariense]KAJ5157037.1 hypothetical protein N7482_008137 [Penicillium canariense]
MQLPHPDWRKRVACTIGIHVPQDERDIRDILQGNLRFAWPKVIFFLRPMWPIPIHTAHAFTSLSSFHPICVVAPRLRDTRPSCGATPSISDHATTKPSSSFLLAPRMVDHRPPTTYAQSRRCTPSFAPASVLRTFQGAPAQAQTELMPSPSSRAPSA